VLGSWMVMLVSPSMTWLLVTITPSERTITPEPSEPSTRERGTPMPNISKNGSTWRTTRLDEMLTTAGAAFFTTGASMVRPTALKAPKADHVP